ncbi:MAG: polysaccharide deacetylase family protein [Candidatus Limnocylindrales bacterium]
MSLTSRARVCRGAVAALVAATLVGACGGAVENPSPSPSASPSAAVASIEPQITSSPTTPPAPSPAPTPFSIVAATSCDPSVVPGAEFPPPTLVPSPGAIPVTLHVPILEYHRIVPLADAGKSLPGLTMPPEIFDAQMAALNKAGWHTITLTTLADDLAAGMTPPSHSFVVTIDDGWWDGYVYAYPTLQKYGYVATFFVIADRIGLHDFLGPSQIQALAEAGNEIGDHTVHHGPLTGALPAALAYEIDSGAATIASITGRWPETLAYPRGKTDARVIAAVAACKSLRMAVVEGSGGTETWANRFRVARIQVGSHRPAADLLAEVQRAGR